MDVELTRTALKGLGKMPTKERGALIEKIKAFARGDLLPPKVLKPFSPTSGRIRHGQWRAVYSIDESNGTVAVLIIEAVGHRREIYE